MITTPSLREKEEKSKERDDKVRLKGWKRAGFNKDGSTRWIPPKPKKKKTS